MWELSYSMIREGVLKSGVSDVHALLDIADVCALLDITDL